ncbi:MAG: 1-acyl-sn-glycerol-3-phosphate acyltransferase [Deltaproteobacteria bacterium]|nr:1-acyl-sn-glycerol-3-phosphate acyltransferase [Deltaproteobacteria bacterium]
MNNAISRFDDIRPFTDSEVPAVMKRLTENDLLISSFRIIKWPSCPELLKGLADWLVKFMLKKKLSRIKTVTEFQSQIIADFLLKRIIETTSDGVTYSGIDKLDKGKSYIFMTNHRDIVMDPALVNYALYVNGFSIPYIAFGDNLLLNEAVSDLIRINNGIIVKRGLARKEQLEASMHLSEYLNHLRKEGNNFWISQREGRAKDGIDRTNPAIINMFYLSERKKEGGFAEFIRQCNIVPAAISYEKDPCDRLKAWELYRKKKNGAHIKRKNEDLISMLAGLSRDKGRIHISFGAPLSGDFEDKNALANAIDREIHTLYRFWPRNFIAYDHLLKTDKYSDKYTETEKAGFLNAYNNLKPEVRNLVFTIYANPVCSFESYSQTGAEERQQVSLQGV